MLACVEGQIWEDDNAHERIWSRISEGRVSRGMVRVKVGKIDCR